MFRVAALSRAALDWFLSFAPRALFTNSFGDNNGGDPPEPGKPESLYADFNGDGCADLAIGAPRENIGSIVNTWDGHHPLWFSRRTLCRWGPGMAPGDVTGVPGDNEDGDRFGEALTAGDFDDDGYWDLAIGAPLENIGSIVNTGTVTILYGSAAGVSADGTQGWHQDVTGVPGDNEDGDRFGEALTAGDFDDDGYWDLAIGAPLENIGSIVEAGMVTILYGSAAEPLPLGPKYGTSM